MRVLQESLVPRSFAKDSAANTDATRLTLDESFEEELWVAPGWVFFGEDMRYFVTFFLFLNRFVCCFLSFFEFCLVFFLVLFFGFALDVQCGC